MKFIAGTSSNPARSQLVWRGGSGRSNEDTLWGAGKSEGAESLSHIGWQPGKPGKIGW